MQNSIPTEAVSNIDTPEYSAHWLNKTGEVWIAMKEPEAVVPHAAITAALQAMWSSGGDPKTLYVSGDLDSIGSRSVGTIPASDIEVHVSDFGTVDIHRFNPAVAA